MMSWHVYVKQSDDVLSISGCNGLPCPLMPIDFFRFLHSGTLPDMTRKDSGVAPMAVATLETSVSYTDDIFPT